jgi:8-oxo-dGTP pyrophosphatase MutT (NUDIX family)
MEASLAERLRPRLIRAEDAAALTVAGRTVAAVLVPLYLDGDGDIHAVFTRRRADLRRHAGEISFPGGRHDEADADLGATALREAEEEIGLAAGAVELVGALPPTPTIATGYAIYPYVGVIEAGRRWALSPREVAEVLELRLRDVRNGYERRRLVRRGLSIVTDAYVVDGDIIWGATARIVRDLLDRVATLLPTG